MKEFENKIPPHSSEAEQTILGGMLVENCDIPEILKILSTDSFYQESHRRIFSATIDAFKERGRVDMIVLVDELKKRGQLDGVGGMAYVAGLTDNFISSVMVGQYSEIIKRKEILRRIISGACEIVSMAYNDHEPLEDVLAKLQELLADVLKRSAETEEASQKLGMSLGHMNDYFSSCRETPFESLNRAIDGFFGGELVIVGASPGMGKTAMEHAFLRHTAIREGRPTIYFGAEMSREIIYARLLSAMCKIPCNDLKRGRIKDGQVEDLVAAHKIIDAAPINECIIKDKISAIFLISQIKKFADNVHRDIGLVIIENLQQITWPGRNFKFRKDEADVILENLRSLGLEMKIPILISCQINRGTGDREDNRPRLSDLKDTGQIEEIADKILLLHRPNYYDKKLIVDPEQGEVIIGKGGPSISLPFNFFGSCLYWEEACEE